MCAVIVTHNPDIHWPVRVRAASAQVAAVVVVDNGSKPVPSKKLERAWGQAPIVFLSNQDNVGIGAAMNRGFRWAARNQFEWILTLDQDSLPAPGMVRRLIEAIERHPARDEIGLVAPMARDPEVPHEARFLRPWGPLAFHYSRCRGVWLDDVTFVNSSGCLHRAWVHRVLGGFREELFLDYVDIDYCLRARRRGIQILVVCGAELRHRVGRRRERTLWKGRHYPTFHDPVRWYYMSRNRVQMWLGHAWRTPHWAVYDALAGVNSAFRMLAFEDRRREKIRMSLRGVWDGIRGRLGALPRQS
ncbi:MAG: glycosyltransferase [Anaerolineales bacterium]